MKYSCVHLATQTLERANEAKANKSEVASALQHKAGTADLNAKLMEINAALATKADGGEVANQVWARHMRTPYRFAYAYWQQNYAFQVIDCALEELAHCLANRTRRIKDSTSVRDPKF